MEDFLWRIKWYIKDNFLTMVVILTLIAILATIICITISGVDTCPIVCKLKVYMNETIAVKDLIFILIGLLFLKLFSIRR